MLRGIRKRVYTSGGIHPSRQLSVAVIVDQPDNPFVEVQVGNAKWTGEMAALSELIRQVNLARAELGMGPVEKIGG